MSYIAIHFIVNSQGEIPTAAELKMRSAPVEEREGHEDVPLRKHLLADDLSESENSSQSSIDSVASTREKLQKKTSGAKSYGFDGEYVTDAA